MATVAAVERGVVPELLGVEALDPLARNGRLVPFLEEHDLLDELGGWLGQAMSIRGQKLVCYHKNWIYFTKTFGLDVIQALAGQGVRIAVDVQGWVRVVRDGRMAYEAWPEAQASLALVATRFRYSRD